MGFCYTIYNLPNLLNWFNSNIDYNVSRKVSEARLSIAQDLFWLYLIGTSFIVLITQKKPLAKEIRLISVKTLLIYTLCLSGFFIVLFVGLISAQYLVSVLSSQEFKYLHHSVNAVVLIFAIAFIIKLILDIYKKEKNDLSFPYIVTPREKFNRISRKIIYIIFWLYLLSGFFQKRWSEFFVAGQ